MSLVTELTDIIHPSPVSLIFSLCYSVISNNGQRSIFVYRFVNECGRLWSSGHWAKGKVRETNETEHGDRRGTWGRVFTEALDSNLSFCQHSWLAANWVKLPLQEPLRDWHEAESLLFREKQIAERGARQQWNITATTKVCLRLGRRETLYSCSVYVGQWSEKLHTRTEPQGFLNILCSCCFWLLKKIKESNSYKTSLEIWKICSPGTERCLNPSEFPQVLSLMVETVILTHLTEVNPQRHPV